MKPIEIPDFSFRSPLARTIIELERLRGDLGEGTTHPLVFDQLREFFQLMSTIMSARIEGNRTTIVDAVSGIQAAERPWSGPATDDVQELIQLHKATRFVDEAVGRGTVLTHGLIREIHKLAVTGLEREGDRTPGNYRLTDVGIAGSNHKPPAPGDVHNDMSILLEFLNEESDQSWDLLKIALAHHRFVWIHPFGNGNGRVGRLLTYAAMRRLGFTESGSYRALSLTAVFGDDRQAYYDRLEDADSLEPDALIRWCTYVLEGLRRDLGKLSFLGRQDRVTEALLIPAIQKAWRSGQISEPEARALTIVAQLSEVKAKDLEPAISGSPSVRSQAIRRLLDKNLIDPVSEGKRSYRLRLAPGPLTPYLARQMDEMMFLPRILRESEQPTQR